jgi:hypothetical protein
MSKSAIAEFKLKVEKWSRVTPCDGTFSVEVLLENLKIFRKSGIKCQIFNFSDLTLEFEAQNRFKVCEFLAKFLLSRE